MHSCLESIPADSKRVFVAFSGGLDSSVLLHMLVSTPCDFQLIPWHINHGLVKNAAQMERFCIGQVQAYGLEIRLDRLELGSVASNIEAVARSQRYRLFEQRTQAGDCILTAHHADDQAETFLLNALRGSGVAGLRGIAHRRYLGKALLIRPLLGHSREQLEAYAKRHEVPWFDDPSNRSLRFDRNYLRRQVVPRVKNRWPNFHRALSACGEIQSETHELLAEIARQDYAAFAVPESGRYARLNLPGLLSLSTARCKNLIRYWIESAGLAALPHARLDELMRQLAAPVDAMPEIAMPEYSIRIYDQQLFLVSSGSPQPGGCVFDFGLKATVEIDRIGLRLTREEVFRCLDIADQQQLLTLRFRQPGEPNSDNHRLKRLFQRHRVPPWKRAQTPQIYLDGRLEGLLL